MIEKRFRKYLAEGYEGKIRAICKEAGIDCSFKDGKLYVDKDDVADAKKAIKADDDIIKLPEIIGESKINEDSVDMEKHNTLNDIFQALERLNTEVDELDALDSDMDSTGVGDLTDQLTTMRKHIGALYQVLDRSGRIVPMESVNEEVDSELMDQVIVQIKRDCDMGDYTAIEELLMSCPEDKLRGFLSEIDESAELNELKKLAGLPQLPDTRSPGMQDFIKRTLDNMPISQKDATDAAYKGFVGSNKGFPSSEDSVRDMLKGIKGAPKPGTPEYERMVQKLVDPSLGKGLDPEKGFAKAPDLPPGPVPMPDPTPKPQARFPDGTPLPSGTPMPDNLPDIPKDAYRGLFKKPMKVPPMSNDLNILRRRAGIK